MAKRKEVYDIMMDEEELQITNGDFVIGESTAQHQKHLLIAEPGNYRIYPEIGVGIAADILNDQKGDLRMRIQKEFENDGMAIDYLDIKNGNININGGYKF